MAVSTYDGSVAVATWPEKTWLAVSTLADATRSWSIVRPGTSDARDASSCVIVDWQSVVEEPLPQRSWNCSACGMIR